MSGSVISGPAPTGPCKTSAMGRNPRAPLAAATASVADGPVLHHQFFHWKIGEVRRGQFGSDADTCGCYQAVGLMQRDAFPCMVPAPTPSPFALGAPERSDAQPPEEPLRSGGLRVPQTAPDLLHRYGAHPGFNALTTQRSDAIRCRSAPQRVDEHC